MTSIPRRARLLSQASITYSGRPFAAGFPSGVRTLPNFVAITAFARYPSASARREQLLVLPVAVSVGGVEEVRARIERLAHRGDRFRLVHRPVEAGHRHASEPQRRDLEPAAAEPSRLHRSPPFLGWIASLPLQSRTELKARPMTPQTVRMLTRYNAWANRLIFDAVARCRRARPPGNARRCSRTWSTRSTTCTRST